jgi:RNA polymerase sigma-70 factor (ECF subfamily)
MDAGSIDRLMHTTSASLLQRLRRPDERAAWDRFVELYTPLLFHWARRVGLQEQDAADLVQDVLTTLVQKLPEFTLDDNGNFRGWLRTVTLNKWRDNARRRATRPLVGDAAALAELPAPAELEDFWEAEYRKHLVDRALAVMRAEFQPTTWQACWQFVVEGRPAAEVAAALGISENAVYIAKSRVLRRLREELEGLLE